MWSDVLQDNLPHIEAPGSARCSYPIVQGEAGKIGFKFSNLCNWPRERKNSWETARMPIKLFWPKRPRRCQSTRNGNCSSREATGICEADAMGCGRNVKPRD